MWIDVYREVTTNAKRYVQGGGCMTVGVAGLIQSGGFGSFSRGFGTAASQLLEAEVVTADGRIRIVNPTRDPDLFWALKGGGGGTFGIVTRVTLRTHDLPASFGSVTASITATSAAAFADLVARLDVAAAQRDAASVDRAMQQLRRIVPGAGSYVSESNYFNRSWQSAFWGHNYARLRAIKSKYDPAGLFYVHHGVGSELWREGGFEPAQEPALECECAADRRVQFLDG